MGLRWPGRACLVWLTFPRDAGPHWCPWPSRPSRLPPGTKFRIPRLLAGPPLVFGKSPFCSSCCLRAAEAQPQPDDWPARAALTLWPELILSELISSWSCRPGLQQAGGAGWGCARSQGVPAPHPCFCCRLRQRPSGGRLWGFLWHLVSKWLPLPFLLSPVKIKS